MTMVGMLLHGKAEKNEGKGIVLEFIRFTLPPTRYFAISKAGPTLSEPVLDTRLYSRPEASEEKHYVPLATEEDSTSTSKIKDYLQIMPGLG